MRLINLTGKKYGRLTVLHRDTDHDLTESKKIKWVCECECGEITSVHGQSLKNGDTVSCGCYNQEQRIERNTTHGLSHSRTDNTYYHMINRCTNENYHRYHDYGGRGITVCDRWKKSFINFLDDMGERPEGKTLDRIDNDKGYCKENCRWATPKEQAQNKRKRKDSK